jgi:hypothetical protein
MSISIKQAREMYGGESEAETVLNLAKAGGYRRIYKYANHYGDKITHTDYKRIQSPGDPQERALFRSPYVHNVVLVYDDGKLTRVRQVVLCLPVILVGVMLALALAADGFFVVYVVQLWRQGTNPAFAYGLQQSRGFLVLMLAIGALVPAPALWAMTRGVRDQLRRWSVIVLSMCISIVGFYCGCKMVWTAIF